jgi:hypothetical protein
MNSERPYESRVRDEEAKGTRKCTKTKRSRNVGSQQHTMQHTLPTVVRHGEPGRSRPGGRKQGARKWSGTVSELQRGRKRENNKNN